MTERTFRITQKQLENLGSLMAAKASGNVILASCGGGRTVFPNGTERRSWSYKAVEKEVAGSAVNSILADSADSICVICLPEELQEVAFDLPNCLWITWAREQISAYYWDSALMPVDICEVVGHSIVINPSKAGIDLSNDFYIRTKQAFGKGTTEIFSSLTVGIAGVSGTGSIVAEQLFRLGVKRLVLVDDDSVEEVNLGRILNAGKTDAILHRNKAEMLKERYEAMGLKSEIVAVPSTIADRDALRHLSQCDVLFGCLDSADGRMQLNRIGTFYTVPLIDVGVKLVSNDGELSEISTAVRYIIPGEASLHSLGVYSTEQLQSESLRRADPAAYQARLQEKYIIGARESAPAVISINMMASSIAVQELINRIHNYRDTPNEDVEVVSCNLLEPCFRIDPPANADTALAKYLGRGDCIPFLDMPFLGGES